jgi:DNA polymerase elongation subunit (family B)
MKKKEEELPVENRYFSTVFYQHGKKSDKLVLVETLNGEKILHSIKNPTISFFVDKENINRERAEMFVPVSDVDAIRNVPYRELGSVLADITGKSDWYRSACKSGAWREAEYKLHQHPSLHQTDIHIEDHYIGKYIDKHSTSIDLSPKLHKAFWDIEVDPTYGNPFDVENCPCPVDALSLYDDRSNTIFVFILRNEDNPQIAEFERNVDSHIKEAVDRFKLKKCQMSFHEDDLDLLSSFFDVINKNLKPDILASWNQHYDFQYSMNRIKRLIKKDPAEVMCPKEFPIKRVFYWQNPNITDWAMKSDYAVCASYTNYIDQLITYANLRSTLGKKDSYDLDSIAREELGTTGKDPLDVPMREFSRHDFKRYIFYNMNDAHLLGRIEKVTGDIDLIYQIAMITRTRIHKAWRKTTSLKNLALKFMLDRGFVMSNNHNIERGNTGKFKGAYVMSPDNFEALGIEVMGRRLSSIFDNVSDLDLSSLYPSIILSCMIDPTNQLGRLTFQTEEDPNDERGYKLAADLLQKDYMKIGHNWFGLPDKDTILRKFLK